jgi:hypothetical protein
MRDVRDGVDLATLQAERRGFILNARDDGYKLHRAGCDAVGAMHSGAYRKIFFEAFSAAIHWLKTESSSPAWSYCGRCSPERDQSN